MSADHPPRELLEPGAELARTESELQFHRGRQCAVWSVEGPGEVEESDDCWRARERDQGTVEGIEGDAGCGDG